MRAAKAQDERKILDQYRMMTEKEAAAFVGYSIRAMQNWRTRGGGPRFVKVAGRTVRYRACDLIEWAESHLVESTSDYGRCP